MGIYPVIYIFGLTVFKSITYINEAYKEIRVSRKRCDINRQNRIGLINLMVKKYSEGPYYYFSIRSNNYLFWIQYMV